MRSFAPYSFKTLCVEVVMRERKDFMICEWQGVEPCPPERVSKLGIAMGTLGKEPINGLRHAPVNGTNGWYLWCGAEIPT